MARAPGTYVAVFPLEECTQASDANQPALTCPSPPTHYLGVFQSTSQDSGMLVTYVFVYLGCMLVTCILAT